MRLSARVDYALRAVAELAAAAAPRTVEQLAAAQQIPNKYLDTSWENCGAVVCCEASADRTVGTGWPDRRATSASPT